MSRILEALKKAMPSAHADVSAPETLKPLIFEKVSFETPTPQTVRREVEVEVKRKAVVPRPALSERISRPVVSQESIHFMWVLSALFVAFLVAAWLWPKTTESPKNATEENVRIHERVAELETALASKQAEIDRIQAAPQPVAAADQSGELESTRGEVRRLNRQLAVMLQDNLEKDQEIAKLSGRS